MADNPYIERIDGKGILRDANGNPILADQFDFEPSPRAYEESRKKPFDAAAFDKEFGLEDVFNAGDKDG